MDEQTRDYLDRLLAEASDARRSLEERFEKTTGRLLTVFDCHSKELHDLHVEYHSLRVVLARVEERIIRMEVAIGRLE